MSILQFPVRAALALAVLGVLAVLAGTAGAAAGSSGQPGMAVVRDPQTGHMRPATAAELRQLQHSEGALRQSRPAQAARAPIVRPDGVRAATLGERGMVYSVIRRGADGRLTEQCIAGEAAAAHAAHQHKPAGTEDRHDR